MKHPQLSVRSTVYQHDTVTHHLPAMSPRFIALAFSIICRQKVGLSQLLEAHASNDFRKFAGPPQLCNFLSQFCRCGGIVHSNEEANRFIAKDGATDDDRTNSA